MTDMLWKQPIPGQLPIEFGEVPYLIASAMHTGEEARLLAAINIEADLRARVDAGTLRVRNSVDLGWHTFPVGAQLRRAVLMPSELVPLFAERGIELQLVNGEETAQMEESNSYSSVRGVAMEAARREFPKFDEFGNPTGEDADRMRSDAEQAFHDQLLAAVKGGTLETLEPLDFSDAAELGDPVLSPSGREVALELLGQLVRYNDAGQSGSSLSSRASQQVAAAAKAARHAAGFYYITEAAQALADAQGLDARRMRNDLERAANAGLLVFRDAGSEVPITTRPVRVFLDWVHGDDIDTLLTGWRVSYRFPRADAAQNVSPFGRPLQAQVQQEDAIVSKILSLGLSPLALPKTEAGRPGVKAKIRSEIGVNALFQSSTVFDKAWQRLRGTRRIAEVP